MKYKRLNFNYTALSFLLFEGYIFGLSYYVHHRDPTGTGWYEVPLILSTVAALAILMIFTVTKAMNIDW